MLAIFIPPLVTRAEDVAAAIATAARGSSKPVLDICPEIEELDLNPVIVTADGAFAVDVRVWVAATERCEA